MNDQSGGTQLTAFDVLRYTNVRRMLESSFSFYVGVMLQAATLGKHIFDKTGRAIDIGWLGLAEFLPIALFVFVSGSVADRYNRKHIAALSLGGELLCALGLVWYSISDPEAVWPIFVIGAIFGSCRAFLSPAASCKAEAIVSSLALQMPPQAA